MGGDGAQRVCVVGAGVAGLTASYLLQQRHSVTLLERNLYFGGHTHTVVLPDGPDAGTPVDTGFIVMNHRNYPLLTRLFERLGVALRDSEMSFGYHDERSGLQYSGGGLNGLFAQRRNLVRPAFLRLVAEIMRFFRSAPAALDAGRLSGLTLGDYLRREGFSDSFVRHHLIPMGAAIWSTPCDRMLEFPAENFVRFFRNHGLLGVSGRPQWKTVAGGSHTYVRRLLEEFRGETRAEARVRRIRRLAHEVLVTTAGGETLACDHVVLAVHADEALALLADPTPEEQRLLGCWRYERNRVALHCDPALMPPLRRVWSSWNYRRPRDEGEGGPATLTYDMNRLQGLVTRRRYFVTLNRSGASPQDTVAEMVYDHPTFTAAALASQPALGSLNGPLRTWYCGSYFGHGFHEDAVRSAVEVGRAFGTEL
jgi:predicted NAD/FAD-binding protein